MGKGKVGKLIYSMHMKATQVILGTILVIVMLVSTVLAQNTGCSCTVASRIAPCVSCIMDCCTMSQRNDGSGCQAYTADVFIMCECGSTGNGGQAQCDLQKDGNGDPICLKNVQVLSRCKSLSVNCLSSICSTPSGGGGAMASGASRVQPPPEGVERRREKLVGGGSKWFPVGVSPKHIQHQNYYDPPHTA